MESSPHSHTEQEEKSIFLSSTVSQIAINGFLALGFVLYCIIAVILLIGISEVWEC